MPKWIWSRYRVVVPMGLLLGLGVVHFIEPPAVVAGDELEEAYRLNREAMEEMSMARFESAARKFLEAASKVTDYGIQGKSLIYSPTFMAAWAYEKLGDIGQACKLFEKFVEVAPQEHLEVTKAEHAKRFLQVSCEKTE